MVELLLVPKPGGKSILAFNHTTIPDSRAQARFRVRWRKAADEIHAQLVEG